jgi:hypothetical protein
MPLTLTQQLYIREHYKDMTHFAIGAQLGLSENKVAYFCKLNNLRKAKTVRGSCVKKVKPPLAPEMVKPKMKRPPAEYGNKSSEDYVNKYLDL